jgi:DNA-binding LacI/PurR family transcriptional regulator
MKSPASTMRDVAYEAKVSTSTVSLALRNSPLVAEPTRVRIRALAERLGYRIHPLVAAHMRSRRKPGVGLAAPVLAIVDTQRRRHGWRDNRTNMVRAMRTGAKAQAAARGFETREFWLHEPGMSHSRFSAMLRARGIHGVLLGPSSDLNLDLDLTWEWLSVVRLGSARVVPPLHRVVIDHFDLGMRAAEKVHELGFRRPLFPIREPFSQAHDRKMEGGFHTVWSHLPGTTPASSPTTEGLPDAAALERWMKRYRPDVIVDNEERHLLGLLKANGWRVPEDVSLVSMCAPALGGPLSGFVQDGDHMAASGIDLLIAMMERNETGVPANPVTISTNSRWNPGMTVHAGAGKIS